MRPDVTSPTPAKDEMGMDYVPVYEEELRGEGGIPGHAAFSLSAERQQLIGVRTGTVERRSLAVEIRTVGKVAYDPGLYQAFVEYREALRGRSRLSGATVREAREGADALVRAAALKLRQQGVSEAQLREMGRDGRDPVNLLLPGKDVWVYAQVYEYEVELVRPGQEMVVTAPALPGRTFRAAVVAVDPILNAMTRSARVRALVSTPEAAPGPRRSSTSRSRCRSARRSPVPSQPSSTRASTGSCSSCRARDGSSHAPSTSDARRRAGTRSSPGSRPGSGSSPRRTS
jgi:Cu(I)/Ag(I) efflux system membrane fusion protein